MWIRLVSFQQVQNYGWADLKIYEQADETKVSLIYGSCSDVTVSFPSSPALLGESKQGTRLKLVFMVILSDSFMNL